VNVTGGAANICVIAILGGGRTSVTPSGYMV
jgi:hypothetical protein